MAIKVGGTTVIDDSRQLSNIASVDATTVAALGAAGVGGGGEVDFVASGAISNGDVVVLNSDGTVSVVSTSYSSVDPIQYGSQVDIGTNASYQSVVYDPDQNVVIVAYSDSLNSNYGTAVAGSVSGTSITFGTPSVFNAAGTVDIAMEYDTTNNKTLVVYRDNGASSHGKAIVISASGTTLSFGAETTFDATPIRYCQVSYDSTNNKFVVVYHDESDSLRPYAVVGSISGTTASFGTPVEYSGGVAGGTYNMMAAYDVSSGKTIVGWRQTIDNNYKLKVGTISGTSISFGTAYTLSTSAISYVQPFYDSGSGKTHLTYSGTTGNIVQLTVSGTSVSAGAAVEFSNGVTNGYKKIAYSPETNSYILAYTNAADSDSLFVRRVTISGSTITVGSAVDSGYQCQNSFVAYDTVSDKAILVYNSADTGVSNRLYAIVLTENTLTTDAADYIGVAAEAISDTATGAITIDGGVNEGQTGLTIGSTYYVANDGSLSTTNNGRKIGRAISSTKLLVNTALSATEMDAYLGGLV